MHLAPSFSSFPNLTPHLSEKINKPTERIAWLCGQHRGQRISDPPKCTLALETGLWQKGQWAHLFHENHGYPPAPAKCLLELCLGDLPSRGVTAFAV